VRRWLHPVFLVFGAVFAGAATVGATDVLVLASGSALPYQEARESLERNLPEGLLVRQLAVKLDASDQQADQVRALGARVIVTLGSQTTAWALEHTEDTPIVFAVVLHPVESGFVRSFERPGGRVTGAALDIPSGVQLRALRDLLGARKVGVLFNPAETGTLIEAAHAAARRAGVELIGVPVSRPNALQSALDTLRGEVDALWSVPDRTVLGRGAAEQLLLFTLKNKIPFMGISEQYVRAGALLGMATSYAENGRQAAARVRQVLGGKPPAAIPVARPESVEVVFNPHIANRLNRRIPPGVRPLSSSFSR
jgi:putative ABC transport system substrate-binding protein